MSQPKRYTIRGIIASDGNAYAEESVSPSGIWVEWDDYAALVRLQVETLEERNKAEAEVERLRASSFVTAVPSEDYEKLRSENKRLRKRLAAKAGS